VTAKQIKSGNSITNNTENYSRIKRLLDYRILSKSQLNEHQFQLNATHIKPVSAVKALLFERTHATFIC